MNKPRLPERNTGQPYDASMSADGLFASTSNGRVRSNQEFFDRKLDNLYRKSCRGNSSIYQLGIGLCISFLTGIIICIGVLCLAGVGWGLLVGFGWVLGLSKDGFLVGFSMPWLWFFKSGYLEFYTIYSSKLLAASTAGVLLISAVVLRPLPWHRRTQLLVGLLAWMIPLILLPGFPILFALIYPLLVVAGHKRWVSPALPTTLTFAVIPSIVVLVSIQLGGSFTPKLWVDPTARIGDKTPSEYWAKEDFRNRALQGAEVGDIYTLQMVLRDFDLTPEQRYHFIGILRRHPNQRTPALEKEYQDLSKRLAKNHKTP